MSEYNFVYWNMVYHFAGNGKIKTFYLQLDARTYQCKYCGKTVRAPSGTTSNLHSHFRRRHDSLKERGT